MDDSTNIGSYGAAGTVEICLNNQWGSICGSEANWTVTDARVVCRQLGYSTKGIDRQSYYIVVVPQENLIPQ